MRHLACLFLSALFSVAASAQPHSLVVKDAGGEIVPFVEAVCQQTNHYVTSDKDGILTLPEGRFADSDTLTFMSMFYEPLSVRAVELNAIAEVVLTPVTVKMQDVVVVPKGYVDNLVKRMAKNFSKLYIPCYIAKVTRLNTVECNGKYREFRGYQGLFGSLDFSQNSPRQSYLDSHKFY